MSDLGTRRTPYSIPDNTEPFPEDRMSWAMEQVPHMTFQENCLLLFLARHSWGRYTKQGDDLIGFVRPEWASVRRIATQIGKAPTSVHRALAGLRDGGYVSVAANRKVHGSDPSDIKIWFFESDDIMREQVRAGEMPLPGIFLAETVK